LEHINTHLLQTNEEGFDAISCDPREWGEGREEVSYDERIRRGERFLLGEDPERASQVIPRTTK
jgi:hypothetical protein